MAMGGNGNVESHSRTSLTPASANRIVGQHLISSVRLRYSLLVILDRQVTRRLATADSASAFV